MSAQESRYRIPFYARAALILLATYLVIYILVIGQEIIVPLVFSGLIAILLTPSVTYLISKGVHRIVAISLIVLATVVIVLGFAFFIAMQAGKFSEELPKLALKFNEMQEATIMWISSHLHIGQSTIRDWMSEVKSTIMSNRGALIGQTFTTITGIIFTATLLPVYIWLILYYQPLLLEFIRRLFSRTPHQDTVGEVLIETRSIIQKYLVGLLFETLIVSAMSIVALTLLGIDYAVLLGILSGLLNLIPYIGTIIAAILPMVIVLLTKNDSAYLLWVLIAYMVIQFIDNNYVLPKIVASKVQINALISVIVVIIGGALWGIPGMFLSIPMTAIVMVICHRIDSLKPWGYLLGDTMPRRAIYRFNFQKRKK